MVQMLVVWLCHDKHHLVAVLGTAVLDPVCVFGVDVGRIRGSEGYAFCLSIIRKRQGSNIPPHQVKTQWKNAEKRTKII